MSFPNDDVLITELEQKLALGSPKSDKPQKQELVSAEIKGLARHLNHELAHDELVGELLPIRVDDVDLLEKVSDGVLHCAFIRSIAPETIPLQKIMSAKIKGRPLNTFEMQANQRLYIDAAISMGLVVVNIGENDLIDAKHHVSLVLGLLWQLLDRQLRIRTGLSRSPKQKQTLDEHKQLVLNWLNDRLVPATSLKVTNFSTDLQDGRIYLILLRCICPPSLNVSKPHHFNDDVSRAKAVISTSLKMGISPLLDESDIVAGHEQLNLAFIQSLIAYCRSQEQEQELSNQKNMEVQADVTLGRVHGSHQIPDHGLAQYDPQLLFYLGMKQHLLQINGRLQPLLARYLHMQWSSEMKSTSGNDSIALVEWIRDVLRHGGGYYTEHGRILRHIGHAIASQTYWSVSLLPGFDSHGLIFTRRLEERAGQYPDWISALTATAIGRTVIGPLETLQIRQQTAAAAGSITTAQLYRGHSANLVRLLPYAYIQFIASNHAELSRGQYSSLLLATGLATALTYPLDIAQTQMAAGAANGGAVRCLWNSVRMHGLVPGVSRGVLPHLLGATTFLSMHLLTEPHFSETFRPEVGGLLSFMTSLIATYPARTVSRQMQMELVHAQPLRSMSQIAYDLVSREGLQGLYKGILPALAKTGPAYLCTAAAYQFLHKSQSA